MTYNLKNVFYLDAGTDLSTTLGTAASTVSGVTMDISAYIDPVAKGRGTGVGLAIYRAHFQLGDTSANGPIGNGETAGLRMGVVVGDLGLTSSYSIIASPDTFTLGNSNQNLVASKDYFGPKYSSYGAVQQFDNVYPSDEVPYVVVRDTLNLVCGMGDKAMANVTHMSVRLECAQISLTGAVLNQLLRTQTV